MKKQNNSFKKIFLHLILIGLIFVNHAEAYTIVTPSDFTFEGAFKIPADYLTGMTVRYINGQQYFYGFGTQPPYRGHLLRYQAPVSILKSTPYPAGINLVDYGDIFQDQLKDTCDNGNGGSAPYIGISGGATIPQSPFWDAISNRMYWNKVISYQNCSSGITAPSIGYSILNDSTPSGQAVGSWYPYANYYGSSWMAPFYGDRWDSDMFLFPKDFSQTYLNGKPFGIGGKSGVSVTSSGPSAQGPTLFAVDEIDPSAQSNFGQLANSPTPLIYHFFGVNTPARLPDFMSPINIPPNVAQATIQKSITNWHYSGHMISNAVFVEGATKWGLIFFANMGFGNTTTKILSSPTPTATTFAVENIGDIIAGSVIQVADGCMPTECSADPTHSGNYPFDNAKVSSVNGNVITLASPLSVTPPVESSVYTGIWYSGGGGSISNYYTPWYIYDPIRIGASVTNPNDNSPANVDPASIDNFQFPNVNYPLKGTYTGDPTPYLNTGAAFDPATNNLYLVAAPQGSVRNVYVYHLNDELSSNWNWNQLYDIQLFINLKDKWFYRGANNSDLNLDNFVNTKDLGIMMSKWN